MIGPAHRCQVIPRPRRRDNLPGDLVGGRIAEGHDPTRDAFSGARRLSWVNWHPEECRTFENLIRPNRHRKSFPPEACDFPLSRNHPVRLAHRFRKSIRHNILTSIFSDPSIMKSTRIAVGAVVGKVATGVVSERKAPECRHLIRRVEGDRAGLRKTVQDRSSGQ